jgi:hypothetical protein
MWRLLARHRQLLCGGRARALTSTSKRQQMEIAYITDVEGQYDYWRAQVENSHGVLVRDDGGGGGDGGGGSLRLAHDDAHFVFGGDAFDHGPGDLRIAAELVALKRRHPRRVHLLIGNRDVNKLRLTAELSAEDVEQRDPDALPGPFWLAGTPGCVGPGAYLRQHPGLRNGRVARLRWLLAHTMGAPRSFEFRRQELALLRGAATVEEVADEEVLESFVASVATTTTTTTTTTAAAVAAAAAPPPTALAPHGPLVLEYLQLGALAVALGNTLFVHGAVADRSAGFVPDLATRWADNGGANTGRDCRAEGASAHEWLAALAAFKEAALAQWAAAPQWDAARERRGGEALMAYAHRAATGGRSCMVSTFLGDDGGVPAAPLPARATAEWLAASGIERVVVGHKPVGQCPLVLRASPSAGGRAARSLPAGLEVCMADTSYSDLSAVGGRGVARSAVTIEGPSLTHNRLRVSGLLSDGRAIAYRLPYCSGCGSGEGGGGDRWVGRRLPAGNWVVRARLEEEGEDGEGGARFLLTRNFADQSAPQISLVEHDIVREAELAASCAHTRVNRTPRES